MAVTLLDLNPTPPGLVRLIARPSFLCELQQETLQIDVYLSYQGAERCFYTYTFTYNESEKALLTWDKHEELTGMELACQFINEQICPQI
jgi:hypothetical protein